MTSWRVIVTYEATIEAPTADEAKKWGEEEVDAGLWQITTSDVERIKTNGDPGNQ